MDVILFAMIITSGLERFMKGASRVLIRLLQVPLRRHLQLIYRKMQFWCYPGVDHLDTFQVPPWGICKNNKTNVRQMPGGMRTLKIVWAIN